MSSFHTLLRFNWLTSCIVQHWVSSGHTAAKRLNTMTFQHISPNQTFVFFFRLEILMPWIRRNPKFVLKALMIWIIKHLQPMHLCEITCMLKVFLAECIVRLLTMSLRAWVMVWLVFPPFIIMAVFTSSTSLGALLSKKRLERFVLGFLRMCTNTGEMKNNLCCLLLSINQSSYHSHNTWQVLKYIKETFSYSDG